MAPLTGTGKRVIHFMALMDSFSARLNKEVGQRIRHIRREKKLTQDFLARALDLTRTAVSNIETGRQQIYLHSLYVVAKALKVDLHRLIPPASLMEINPLEARLSTQPITAESRRRIAAVLGPILQHEKVTK